MMNLGEGVFLRARYDRPDPMRAPELYRAWLESVCRPGEESPLQLPVVEEAYSIKPAAEKRWFIVYTDPRREQEVVEEIRDKGHGAFSPMRKAYEPRLARTRDLRVIISRPLVPQYVFLALPSPSTPFGEIRGLDHVQRFLGVGGLPCPIEGHIVADLQEREAEGEFDETIKHRRKGYGRADAASKRWAWIVPGAPVRAIDGPFASFPGVVEEVDHGRQVAKVGVSIFGRVTPVELEFDQFERS